MGFELGSMVKDKLTDFEGMVIGRTEYLTGQSQLCFSLEVEGGIIYKWFDEERFELIKK